jgi:DNA-binding response OmpR family regulator
MPSETLADALPVFAGSAALEDNSARRLRILIADDDADIYSLIAAILSRDFECIHAKDGREALSLAKTIHPDLLILDVNMPHLSGLDVLSELRENAQTAPFKIILLTAADSQDVFDHFMDAKSSSPDGYLRKPFRPSLLLQRVRTLLQSSNSPS